MNRPSSKQLGELMGIGAGALPDVIHLTKTRSAKGSKRRAILKKRRARRRGQLAKESRRKNR